jgi:hypothetical protein
MIHKDVESKIKKLVWAVLDNNFDDSNRNIIYDVSHSTKSDVDKKVSALDVVYDSILDDGPLWFEI